MRGSVPASPPPPPSASANRITALICPYRTSVALCQAQGLAPLVRGWGSCPPSALCMSVQPPPAWQSPLCLFWKHGDLNVETFLDCFAPPPPSGAALPSAPTSVPSALPGEHPQIPTPPFYAHTSTGPGGQWSSLIVSLIARRGLVLIALHGRTSPALGHSPPYPHPALPPLGWSHSPHSAE